MDQQNMKSKISSSLECALPLQTEENNNNENARDKQDSTGSECEPQSQTPRFQFRDTMTS